MRLLFPNVLFLSWTVERAAAFATGDLRRSTTRVSQIPLFVSVGLGPQKTKEDDNPKKELVAGVDYEVPDHESYRTSRRSQLDEQCDEWYGSLLGSSEDIGILTSLAKDAREILMTPVPLINEVCVRPSI
jgi:hypothetical protein